jgi:ubiquitin fusion degradation protein 1
MVIHPAELTPEPAGFVAFRGEGNSLDGKKKDRSTSSKTVVKVAYQGGVPEYNYEVGTPRFLRISREPP